MKPAVVIALLLCATSSAVAGVAEQVAAEIRSRDPMKLGKAMRELVAVSNEDRQKMASVVVPAILEVARSDAIGLYRANALLLIGSFKDKDGSLWKAVKALLFDHSAFVRQIALRCLGTFCQTSGVKAKRLSPLLLVGLMDPDWMVRCEAAEVAARAKAPLKTLVPVLAAALADPGTVLVRKDPQLIADVRLNVVEDLARAGKEAAPAKDSLVHALSDRDAKVRAGAAKALGAIGAAAHGAERALDEVLRDPTPQVRLAAVRALVAVGASKLQTGRRLGDLLRDGSTDVALAAAQALASLPALAAHQISALYDGLKHADARVRVASARALGAIGPKAKRAIRILERVAAHDKAQKVRAAAKEALRRIRTK